MRLLNVAEAERFYDGFGVKQDSQLFDEASALEALVTHAKFDDPLSVFEFGCGTGRFADELLARHLPPRARYRGVDVSRTMVARTSGEAQLDLPDASQDRFVSTYVLDLLSTQSIRQILDEAHRALVPGGRLCLTGITAGTTGLSRLVMGGWRAVAAPKPSRVGGCRPIRLTDWVGAPRWDLRHHEVVVAYGVASEVLVAVAAP